jgi:signal transduction histidine kinase
MRSRWRRGGDADVHPGSTRPPTRGARLAGYVGGVFSSFSARRAARACPPDGGRATGPGQVPWAIEVVRNCVFVTVLVTVPFATPHVGDGAQGIAIGVALGVCVIAWVAWMRAGERYMAVVAALAVLAAAGGTLAGLSTFSPAVAVGCVVTSAAGSRLEFETSAALTLETVAAFLIAGIAVGAPAGTLVGYPAAFLGLWAFGLTRREYLLRAEQAEQALEQARRAHAAETQAAALGERARIAREIHDVLAHSLAAVSVNLQAAEGLLSELPGDRPELAKAIECVERAGAFTREGMAEARRAILALRDGGDGVSASPPRPLAEQLEALAGQYRADGDMPVEFTVTGDPRPVSAEAGLAVYRTAQEALTNARKHAPGQPVRLTLDYAPAEITMQVVNPLPTPDTERPLAASGAGYGLTGLRERAALSGGTLTAGPADGEWRVSLRIPA